MSGSREDDVLDGLKIGKEVSLRTIDGGDWKGEVVTVGQTYVKLREGTVTHKVVRKHIVVRSEDD